MILACLLILLLCVSCTSVDDRLSDVDALAICLISDMGNVTSQTRGDGIITESLSSNLPVSFLRTDYTPSGIYTGGSALLHAAIHKDDGRIMFHPFERYLPDGGNTRFVGWYPRVEEHSGTLTFAIDGSTDIMVAQPIEGNKEESQRFSAAHPAKFEHLLTQLRVHAKAGYDNCAADWGRITAIEVMGKKERCVVQLPASYTPISSAKATWRFEPAGTGADHLTLWGADHRTPFPYTLPSTAGEKQEIGYVLCSPHPEGKFPENALQLTVTTDKEITETVWLPYRDNDDRLLFEAGAYTHLTLTFSRKHIAVGAVVIDDWKNLTPDGDKPVEI